MDAGFLSVRASHAPVIRCIVATNMQPSGLIMVEVLLATVCGPEATLVTVYKARTCKSEVDSADVSRKVHPRRVLTSSDGAAWNGNLKGETTSAVKFFGRITHSRRFRSINQLKIVVLPVPVDMR